jgi:acetyl-CoA synthetase (ADP-forming)
MQLQQLLAELSEKGIPVAKSFKVQDAYEAAQRASEIGFPVALKVISQDVLHKTDKGCVKLNLRSELEVRSAFSEIIKNAGNARVEGMLVQQMSPRGTELIIGGKRDAQFGQMVLFGLGGIFVELLKDYSMRVCPVDEREAARMIGELKALPILKGARGGEAVDLQKLAKLVSLVSEFLVEKDFAELDLNPVICNSRDCLVVDARAIE